MPRRRYVLLAVVLLALCSVILVEAQESSGTKKKKSGTKKKKKVSADGSFSAPSSPVPPTSSEAAEESASSGPSPSSSNLEDHEASPPPPKTPEMRAMPKKASGAPQQMLSLRRLLSEHAPGLEIPKPAGIDLVKQMDYALEAVPGLSAMFASNFIMSTLMKDVLGITKFPPPVVGMFAFFGTMLSLKESDADKFVAFFEPSVKLLTIFLPVFFSPGLIRTPAAARGTNLIDFMKFTLIISLGLVAIIAQTGYVTEYVMKLSKTTPPESQPPAKGTFKPVFSQELELIFGALTAGSGILALVVPYVQQVFYTAATFFSFIFAARLPRVMPPTLSKYWHPLMTTYFAATLLLVAQGMLRGKGLYKVLGEYLQPGGPWSESAGNFIMKFLEPAIISFSFGLYSRRQLLKENAAAILAGSFSSAFLGTVTMAILIRIIGVPLSLGLALMPRATAAMAVVQAAMIEASTALTTVHCCFIGLLGANFGPAICDALGLRNPIARGVANGGSGLALASAALASTDPAAFPFGTLTMTLTSTIATILFSMPPFQQMLFYIAGVRRVVIWRTLSGSPAPDPTVQDPAPALPDPALPLPLAAVQVAAKIMREGSGPLAGKVATTFGRVKEVITKIKEFAQRH